MVFVINTIKKEIMKKTSGKFTRISPFLIIVAAAIMIQLLGRYHATDVFVVKRYFYTLWVVLRIGVPFIIVLSMGIPLSRLGFRLPEIDRKMAVGVGIIFLLLIACFVGAQFYQSYFNSYANVFHSGIVNKTSRFINFLIFTSSTLIGWEILHRGFLLMGIRYVLVEKEGVSDATAIQIAVGIVWIFEVVYHFIKPEPEAFGLLIGSPLLSYIAIRSKSILLPFLIHLSVEMLFITALLMR